MKCSLKIQVTEMSQVGEARRIACQYGRYLFPSETDQGKIALIVTELATNLLKHGHGGVLFLTEYETALDIISVDHGPGIFNIGESLQDGYSTTGTFGTGLGAVKRLSTTFDIFSIPQKVTVLLSRLGTLSSQFEYGAVSIPLAGETECGDSWAWQETGNSTSVMVVDGLGHGFLAAQAAYAAVHSFRDKRQTNELSDSFKNLDLALKSSRGAALSILKFDSETKNANFMGIGNVTGMIFADSASKRMISHNGIVGQNMRKLQDFSYPCADGKAVFILHSDGVSTHWDLGQFPGLALKHPALIANLLVSEFTRGRDDATVVVFRNKSETHE